MTKKLIAVFLAVLMAFSVFSILGSAVDLDSDTGLVDVAENPATIDINVAFVDASGNAISDMGSVAPGSTVKARVSVGTNYYTGGATLRFYYPTDFFQETYANAARYPAALNSSNASVGTGKITDIGIIRNGTSGNDTIIDIATYVSDWDADVFQLDGSTWLFEVTLTVKSNATGTASFYIKASDFGFDDAPGGYNNIEYAVQGDCIADTIPLEWASSADFTITSDADEVTTGNSVTFNAVGGTFAVNNEETVVVEGTVGESYTVPADPEKDHWTFLGWYEDAAYTTPATPGTMPVEQGVVYYAKWNENVIIHFDETGDNTVADQEVSGGIAWPAADKPTVTKQGYKFMGWEGEGVVNGELPANYPTAAAGNNEYTYTATWSKYLTITFDANGGTFTDGNAGTYSGNAIYGGAAWDTSAVPTYNVNGYAAPGISRPGYALTGWRVNGSGRITQFPATYPDDDVTYTAIWQPYNIYIHYIVDPDAATAADIDITTATDTKFIVARYSDNPNDTIELASYSDVDGTVLHWVDVSASPAIERNPGSTPSITDIVSVDANGRPLDVYLVASASEILQTGQYTAFFDPNGGKWADDTTQERSFPYAPNATIVAPANPTKAGFSFDGWSPALGTMGAEDIHFKAIWTPNDYTVNFINNYAVDDTSVYESLSFSADNDVEFPDDPEREGYTFAGWFTDAACTAGNEFEDWSDLPAASSTFSVYAKWVVIQYELTVYLNGGSLATGATDPSGDYDYGADFPQMPAVEREGYSPDSPAWVFTETDSGDPIAQPSTMPAYDVTATAQWKKNHYVINFDSNGGSEVASITADYGDAITAPAEPTREGYTFAGWFEDDETFAVPYTVPATMPALGATDGASITVYANWTVNKYDLSVDLAQGSLATGATDPSGEYDYNFAFPDMPAVEREGYSLDDTAPWKYYKVVDGVVIEEIAEPSTMPAYDVKAEAQWQINQYTITFDTDGGTVIPAITQDYDTPVTRPADPTREGYTFAGWDKTIPGTMPAEDVTITAQWTINQYTITFNTDGGTEIPAITQDYNTAVTAPADPTKTGYTFAGWDKNIPATMPAENVTITALWTINQYTITFDTAGGTTIPAITQNYNTDITAPADPTKEGYTFGGWQPSIPEKMPAGDMTVVAQWNVNQYTITFNSKGGSAVGSKTQDYNTEVTAPDEPSLTGYTFGGWYYDDETFENQAQFPMNMPAENITLFAKWTINQYTITFDTAGGSEVAAITQDYNTDITAPANPTREGYTFQGWQPSIPEKMPAGDMTVVAQWQINQYTITFDTDGGSYIAPITQDFNTAVTAPADPTKTGYTFAGWDKNIPATMPAENVTITANWTINQYTITFDTDGGSAIPAITQDYNTAVTAPADPTKEGYTFAGWDKNIPETMPAEDVTITASWTINQYTITFDTDGGTEIPAITQDYNTAVTAPADPTKTGYTFAGWDKEIPTAMPAENVTITASWTINQYTITFDSAGGSSVAAITQDYDTDVTAPADPTKEGYTFQGWQPAVPAKMPAENTTVVAQWTINQYTITFDTDGGTEIPAITQDYNTAVTAPSNPTKTGYTFAGWDKEIPATMPAENVTITALWTINQYTITFDTKGGSTIAPITQNYNTDVTAPERPTKSGFSFTNWFSDPDCTVATSVPAKMPAENITLYAGWGVNTIHILLRDDNGEKIPGYNLEEISGEFDTNLPDVPEPVREGYTFTGWQPALPEKFPSADMTVQATWQINQYTITFDSAGGSAVAAITQDYNTAVTAPADPTREGYTFAGWQPAVPATMPAENTTVVAQWNINQYTITFDTAGGSSIDPITQDYNSAVTAPANPTREGYTFAGWDKEIPATMPAENVTITASWTINQYTITFNTDGGTEIPAITQDYNTAVTAPADPTKEGYTFDGWDKNIPATMPAENVTITANWKINQYTITFDTAGGSEIAAITQDYNTAVTAPADPTREGYTFDGWDKEIPATMPAEDVTITASWKINQYTITFDTDGGSEVAAITQDYNTDVTAPADPTKEGYTFAGWDKTIPSTMPAENITITALWNINQYTITFDSAGGSSVDAITQNYDTDVTAPADPTRTGYTFAGWQPAVPAKMPAENITVVAQWTINQYTITFNTDGGSSIDPITQDYDTDVTAPADPTKPGYTFAGWQPSIPAKMPASNTTVTAQWTVNQYTITFDTAGGSTIDPITQDYNTAVTAPADPTREGYTFAGWDKEIPTAMPAENVTITASWTINQYTITFDSAGGSDVAAITQNYNTDITAPDDPTKEGYTFGGWQPSIPEKMPAGDMTVVAQWTVNQYTITFDSNGGSNVAAISKDYGEVISAPANPTKTGYTFDGWFTDNETFENPYEIPETMPADNVTVYAKWKINQYTVTFNTNAGSAVDPITQDYDTVIDPVPQSEKTGFQFQGWYLDNDTFTQPFNNRIPADNITVYAKWGINSITITFDSKGGSAVQPIHGDYNTDAHEPAEPTYAGYDFDGWYEDENCTGNPFFRDGLAKFPATSITLYAKWTRHVYTVKFLEPDSYNDPTPTFSEPHDDHIFENNIQEVAFEGSATVPSGNPEINYYTFVGWSTEPNGTPVDFDEWTMPAAETDSFYFYPVFERVPVTLEIALESGSQADIIKVDDQAVTGYIYNAGNKLTVAKLQAQLVVIGNGTLNITASKNGKICGTGTKVELIDNLTGEVVETYYLIVAGDVNGDALCTANDKNIARNVYNQNLSSWLINDTDADAEAKRVCAALAADVNGDGAFDGEDADMMELFALGAATYSYNTETHKYNVSVN